MDNHKNVQILWIIFMGSFVYSWSKSNLVVLLTFIWITYIILKEENDEETIQIPDKYVNWITNLRNASTRDEVTRSKIQLKDMLHHDDFLKGETHHHELRGLVNRMIQKYDTKQKVPFESNIERFNPHSIVVAGYEK